MNISRFLIFALLVACALIIGCEDVDQTESLIEDVPTKQTQKVVDAPAIESEPTKVEGCGDGVCQPSETKCTCAKDCGDCKGDASNITEFRCEDGKCKILVKANMCGNAICDAGEFQSCPGDCPSCDPDNNPCTKDAYDDASKACLHEPIIPCCGNQVCEPASEQGSCLIDCKVSNLTLKDYPKPFIENRKFNTHLIVGANGQGASVAAGIDVIRGLGYNGSNPGYDTKARLDSEIESIQDTNVILLGSSCENKWVASLMKPGKDCHDGLEPGVGLIRLYQTGPKTYALVIAGYSGDEVRRAAKIVEKYQQYGIAGYNVEVR